VKGDKTMRRILWLAHVGPDRRVYLEGGDDGVTYTSDGVHPNAAGASLEAAQLKTALGH
jgi:lysophospholipase L1-like esterase